MSLRVVSVCVASYGLPVSAKQTSLGEACPGLQGHISDTGLVITTLGGRYVKEKLLASGLSLEPRLRRIYLIA